MERFDNKPSFSIELEEMCHKDQIRKDDQQSNQNNATLQNLNLFALDNNFHMFDLNITKSLLDVPHLIPTSKCQLLSITSKTLVQTVTQADED